MDKEKLIHRVTIKGDPRYKDLSLSDKVKLMDDFLNPASSKALMVDFNFSHTGRKINRRIYSKAGHIQTATDLVTPYFKPITLNHDSDAEKIIGRIVGASWTSLADDAARYLTSRSISPLIYGDLDKALTLLDFEKIRDLLKKYNLQNDKRWMGIGAVAAKARISDKDAIEKFIDGRFQTFSAETDSDMYVCSECLTDWYKNSGPCEHMGDSSMFHMTGNMIGGGSSVVTHPADDLSFVTSMGFSDSVNKLDIPYSIDDIMLVDSKQQLVIMTHDDQKSDQEILMDELIKKFALDTELTADEAETLYNSLFDLEEIKAAKIIDDGKEIAIKDAKLTKKQRAALPKSSYPGIHRNFPVIDASHVYIAQWMLSRVSRSLSEDETEENCEECVQLSEEEAKEVDWAALDIELETEVETESVDAKLSTEARNELSSKSFCGPGRSFPVSDCAHVTAARRLIGRTKVSDSTKAKILACVSRKAKNLSCGGTDDSVLVASVITATVDRRAKAFGCDKTSVEVEKDIAQIKVTVDAIVAQYSLEQLKSLDSETFVSKVFEPVKEIAKGLNLLEDKTVELTKELEVAKEAQLIAEKALTDTVSQKDLVSSRYDAIKIEYKELFSDHKEMYSQLDEKNETLDSLSEKIVRLLKVIDVKFDANDKSIKNIYSLLDSLDLTSLESKLNDGLTNHKISPVENPIKKTDESSPGKQSLPGFDKKILEEYKKVLSTSGEKVANKWFDTVKKYCSKDFHPSKFME